MRASALASLATLCATLAVAQSTPLSVDALIARVAAKSVTNGVDRNGLMCTKTETVYDTSGAQERLKRTTVWDIWYRDGETWQRTMSENGIAVIDPVEEKTKPDFTTTLATLYHYELDDPPLQHDPFTTTLCWAIRFRPNPDAHPNGIKEEIASRLSGIMYVDRDDFWIRYAKGSLEKTYRKWLFIGKVSEFSFILEQTIAPGAVMPRTIQVRGRGTAFLFHKRNERAEVVFSDFRPLGPAVSTPTPPR